MKIVEMYTNQNQHIVCVHINYMAQFSLSNVHKRGLKHHHFILHINYSLYHA